MIAFALGGLERIRTAVEAFAELCLATRPQDHIFNVSMSELNLNGIAIDTNSDCKSTSLVPNSQSFSKKIIYFV